jgi:hypothetical protein
MSPVQFVATMVGAYSAQRAALQELAWLVGVQFEMARRRRVSVQFTDF